MHKQFRKLLEHAVGISQHVIAINLDIRGFSSFCKHSQDWDVANYIKRIYSKILDEYFRTATYFKATGDGLIVIFDCESEEDITEKVNFVLKSCLELVKNFSTLCAEQKIINFETPTKIGIGIARGSICCIYNKKEEKILDYSGRVLNLASRLMDMARPAGIVFEENLGHDIIKDEVKELFAPLNVYVRGIAEKNPITVYYTKRETSIPKEYRSPRIPVKATSQKFFSTYGEIKQAHGKNMVSSLDDEPINDNEVYLKISFRDSNGTRNSRQCSNEDADVEVGHSGKKHFVRVNREKLVNDLAEYNVSDDEKVIFDVYYLVEEK